MDFCKKKLNTHSDTHCIKIGVQLWLQRQGSSLRPLGYKPQLTYLFGEYHHAFDIFQSLKNLPIH